MPFDMLSMLVFVKWKGDLPLLDVDPVIQPLQTALGEDLRPVQKQPL
jgi:hypothetical protein